MRIAYLPEGEGSRVVSWEHVSSVRYFAEGTRRFLILTYINGMERNLEVHQARDLFYQVHKERHKRCSVPCYYRHEGDTAPPACVSCKLAEMLEGVDCPVRPPPLPPPRIPRPDRRAWIIAGLIVLWLITLYGWARTNAIARAEADVRMGKAVER